MSRQQFQLFSEEQLLFTFFIMTDFLTVYMSACTESAPILALSVLQSVKACLIKVVASGPDNILLYSAFFFPNIFF